jgi:chlorobactene glucosyltransferase
LQSLLAQDYPLLEVLVLDDGSTDATADIVTEMAKEDPRLRLVRGRPLPQGWMGKNYACHQLSQLAHGDWFLFTDADTYHRPGALAWAIEAMQQNQADLVSLVPHTVTHTLGEELLLPIIPFGLVGCFPLALSMHLRVPWLTAALGTFMLFRRETYERINGHQGVSGEIAEDMVLARRVRGAGGRVILVNGSEKVDVHFYHGFRESWRGLAKSVFAALGYRLVPTLLMIGFHGFLFLWPVILCMLGLLKGQMGDPAQQLALLTILLNGGLWYTLAVRFHLPRRTALLYPLTIAFTILIVFDSIRRAAFGGIGWKERVYHVHEGTLRH